jgi:hypothetical protein
MSGATILERARTGRPVPDDTRVAPAPPAEGLTAEAMGEASFPASDPPATWTWEVPRRSSP